MSPGELSFDIVWKHGDSSNTVTVNCSEEAQLEQWVRIMRAVSPSDALSVSLDSNGGSSYVLFSDIDDLLSREGSSMSLTSFASRSRIDVDLVFIERSPETQSIAVKSQALEPYC